MGLVYLLHAERGLHCTGNRFAQHYVGYTTDWGTLALRMAHHANGRGARLVHAWQQAGIAWRVARVWEDGTRDFERQLKNRRNHPKLCPCCAVDRRTGYYAVWPPDHPPRSTRRELQVVRDGLRAHRDAARIATAAEALLRDLDECSMLVHAD